MATCKYNAEHGSFRDPNSLAEHYRTEHPEHVPTPPRKPRGERLPTTIGDEALLAFVRWCRDNPVYLVSNPITVRRVFNAYAGNSGPVVVVVVPVHEG